MADEQGLQFAARSQAVMEAHPWADATTVSTVAGSTQTPSQAVEAAGTLGDQLRQTWDGFSQSYADPVLQQQPSTGLALARYVHETLGPPPIEAGHLTDIQSALQKAGVGNGLAVSGAWTPQWQQAWNDQMQTEYQNQLAGQKPGSIKTSSFLHRVLHIFTPSGAADAVIGWGKDVRNTVGDVAGAVAGTADDAVHGFGLFGHDDGKALFASIAQHTDNLLGANTTAAAQRARHENPLNLAGDVLNLTGVGSIAKGLGKSAAGQAAKGAVESGAESAVGSAVGGAAADESLAATQALAHANNIGQALHYTAKLNLGGVINQTIAKVGAEWSRGTIPAASAELVRGPGVIAKTLFRASDGAAPQTLDDLISPHWYDSMPLISRLAPAIAKTAEADGWYYSARSALAQAYRYAPVRAAGAAFSGLQRAGLVAGAQSLALPGSSLSQNIQNTNTLSAWDTNLANHGPRFLGMSLLDPNNAQAFLHGPLSGAGASSKLVGELVHNSNQNIIDTLGSKGFPAAIQQALATGSKIMSRKDMLEAVGGDPLALNQFTKSLAIQVARAHYIENTLGKSVDGTDQATNDAAAVNDDAFWKSPGVAAKALKDSLEGDPDVQWATNRLKQIFLKRATDPKTALAQTYKEWHEVTQLGQQAHASGDTAWYITPKQHALINAHNEATAPAPFADTPEGHPTPLAHTAENAQRILPNEPGMFGFARTKVETAADGTPVENGYQTSANVAARANAFEKALTDAGGNVKAVNQVFNQMRQYLFDHAGRDVRDLDVFAPTPEKLLDQIRTFGEKQAGDVSVDINAPEAVRERLDAIKAAGYKPVVGNHIGHVFDGTEPDLGSLGNWTSRMRNWAQRAGLNPSAIRDSDTGRATHLSLLQALVDVRRNDANVKWGSMVTPNTILGLLTSDKAIDDYSLPWFEQAVLAGTRKVGLNKSNIEKSMAEGATRPEAQAKLEADIAYQQSIRDLPVKKIVATLEKPQLVTTRTGSQWNYPGMSHYSAVQTAAALAKGYKLPTYMMGASAIENWARAGVGFGDVIRRHVSPDSALNGLAQSTANVIDRVGSWPNQYVRIRNQLRFQMNPKFDEQRLTKTSYKMGIEGVPPVKNPLDTLGPDADSALARYERITGNLSPEDMQHLDADKYARAQSIWGIYSPIWHAAYFMHNLAAQGKSDQEILGAYHRAFTYGSGGGRSAFERTVNTIFFPFSFEKTVIKSGVGYLLDHPAQALLVDAGVDEWRKLDKNDQVGKFLQGHLPALALLNQLNAFSHGVSLGQLGGINAPVINPIVKSLGAGASMPSHDPQGLLLNMFMPQNWGPNYTKANLQQMAPLWKQFSQVWKAGGDQAQVAFNAAANGLDDVMGKQGNRTIIAPSAQLDYALKAKTDMVAQMQKTLDFNQKQSSVSDMVKWNYRTDVPANIQGKPVNKATIGLYIQHLYPAYSPTAAAAIAQQKAVAADKFIAQIAAQNPAQAKAMTSFKDVANQVIGKINRDTYTPAELAQIQEQFRQAAKTGAEHSGDWLTFYNRYFASRLGPIEDFTGKGVTH